MASTSSIIVQSLGKIVQRAPAVGTNTWCLYVFTDNMLLSGKDQAANCRGIKFTHRPKIRFFAPQGRLVAPIHVKLGTADGHVGPLGCAKFQRNRHRGGVGIRPPKYQKFPLLVKSRPAGAIPLTDFENFYGLLYAQLSY